jgi:type IV pilus assembly protein PilB
MAERPKLGELLVAAGAINQTQLGAALGDQRQYGRPLGITLVRLGYLDEETLVRALARQLKLPIAWLRDKWVGQEVLDLVPAELALKHRCLPLVVKDDGHGKVLHLAMQDPGDLETLDAVQFHVGHNVSPVLAAPSELEEALQRHYESGKSKGRATANRPEVQELPEMLTFETKAQAATPETNLEFVTEPSDESLMSSQSVFSGLTQLLTVLMDKGIVSREEAVQWFRNFLATKTADR